MIEKDGELVVTDLSCRKGQYGELIVLTESSAAPRRPSLTARKLLDLGLVGIWKERQDIRVVGQQAF